MDDAEARTVREADGAKSGFRVPGVTHRKLGRRVHEVVGRRARAGVVGGRERRSRGCGVRSMVRGTGEGIEEFVRSVAGARDVVRDGETAGAAGAGDEARANGVRRGAQIAQRHGLANHDCSARNQRAHASAAHGDADSEQFERVRGGFGLCATGHPRAAGGFSARFHATYSEAVRARRERGRNCTRSQGCGRTQSTNEREDFESEIFDECGVLAEKD